jgi:hypothetical protein
MKKAFILIMLIVSSIALFAEKKEDIFKKYTDEKYYEVNNGEIVVSKILEGVPGTKDEIYNRIKSFFVRTYKDGKSVIQVDDKEAGVLIGKGQYFKIVAFSLGGGIVNADHILRVDIKDGRIRVVCSISTMTNLFFIPGHENIEYEYHVVDYAPFTNKRSSSTKSVQLSALIKCIELMHYSIDNLEKAVKVGLIKGENRTDW